MRTSTVPLIAGLLAVAGCGVADEPEDRATEPTVDRAADAATVDDSHKPANADRAGIKLRVGRSEFGKMLFDSNKQAIYVFQRDRRRKSRCYGACAEAWPPVFANGESVAGKGVKAALLGTIKRRGGRRQVTYAGKPLYYYAHEQPGEVLCHNVNFNGGFGPNGKPRP
jgi:predicted lipoprotein with Yx(FWY)xxD motif